MEDSVRDVVKLDYFQNLDRLLYENDELVDVGDVIHVGDVVDSAAHGRDLITAQDHRDPAKDRDLIELIKNNILQDKIREQEQINELKRQVEFLKTEILHKNHVINSLLTHIKRNEKQTTEGNEEEGEEENIPPHRTKHEEEKQVETKLIDISDDTVSERTLSEHTQAPQKAPDRLKMDRLEDGEQQHSSNTKKNSSKRLSNILRRASSKPIAESASSPDVKIYQDYGAYSSHRCFTNHSQSNHNSLLKLDI